MVDGKPSAMQSTVQTEQHCQVQIVQSTGLGQVWGRSRGPGQEWSGQASHVLIAVGKSHPRSSGPLPPVKDDPMTTVKNAGAKRRGFFRLAQTSRRREERGSPSGLVSCRLPASQAMFGTGLRMRSEVDQQSRRRRHDFCLPAEVHSIHLDLEMT